MNIKTVRTKEKRIDTHYLSRFNLQSYGGDNLYPQDLLNIVGASGTAELCLDWYAKFIEGSGFADTALNELQANPPQIFADILHGAAYDTARFGGFALLVNYNILGEVSSVYNLPFEQCRLEEPDEDGNVQHIVVHPDWTGKSTRNGQRLTVSDENITRYPVFDPTKAQEQMLAAGGWQGYKGQVLWCSLAGKDTYPKPIYDAALAEICTDEALGTVKYRNAKNNFLLSCMIVTRKSGEGDENAPRNPDRETLDAYDEQLKVLQGDENALKIMHVSLDPMEEKPEIVPFQTKNFDKDFTATEASVVERIYAQFHQEIFHSIRLGKLGFSGRVMQDAYAHYAGEVVTEQQFICRHIAKILANWWQRNDYTPTIAPMKYFIPA